MAEKQFPEWKRWLLSSLVTFLAGFGMTVAPIVRDISFTEIGLAGIVGLIFVGARGGVKFLLEYLLGYYNK